jgi:hypothetical protein
MPAAAQQPPPQNPALNSCSTGPMGMDELDAARTTTRSVAVSVAFAVLAGCTSSQAGSRSGDAPLGSERNARAIESCEGVPPPSSAARVLDANGPYSNFRARALSIRRHRLTAEVSYSDGCGDHDFRLCFMGVPPRGARRVTLKLVDRTTNSCDLGIVTTLTFDLSPLRRQMEAAFEGPVLLELPGTEPVRYDPLP